MQVQKILLADDDGEDRLIIQDALQFLGVENIIWNAENGVHALEILEKNYEDSYTPCLIILDLNMPKLNGTKTLNKLKSDERFKNIPVIIYSTSINPHEKEKCLLLGAHSYITKPLSFTDSIEVARIFLQFCKLTTYSNSEKI